MLEAVRKHLGAGDRERARRELASALKTFFTGLFISGKRDHPLLSAPGARLLAELEPLSPDLLDDPARADEVVEVLRSAQVAAAGKKPDAAVLLLLNHSLELVLPGFAVLAGDAVQDAKFEVGARDSNVEGPFSSMLGNTELAPLAEAFGGASRAIHGMRHGNIEEFSLGDLDAPEDALPGLPAIQSLEGEQMQFACSACGQMIAVDLPMAGLDVACPCGATARAPIPSLVRLATHRKAQKEAAMGVGRCRVCRAVIQKGRDGFMRAGFCGPFCAKQAPELFREFVPRAGTIEGEDVVFGCHCGARLGSPRPTAGTRLSCGSCGIDVWVPDAAAPAGKGRAGVAVCGKCGRNVKGTAAKCMYCGTRREA